MTCGHIGLLITAVNLVLWMLIFYAVRAVL